MNGKYPLLKLKMIKPNNIEDFTSGSNTFSIKLDEDWTPTSNTQALVDKINSENIPGVVASLVKPGKRYFTPSVEDFRIGYEFEIAVEVETGWVVKTPKRRVAGPGGARGRVTPTSAISPPATEIKWIKHILTKDNKLDNIKKKIDRGEIRVTFIDAEDFNNLNYFISGASTLSTNAFKFANGKHVIHYDYIGFKMLIFDNSESTCIYNGTCRCINDFRLICKMLKIE